MAKLKTTELTGAALDIAVALALGWTCERAQDAQFMNEYGERKLVGYNGPGIYGQSVAFNPSTDWAHGGPLIDQFNVDIGHQDPGYVVASIYTPHGRYNVDYRGPDALTAICRAVVAAKFGLEVEIPDELLGSEDHAG